MGEGRAMRRHAAFPEFAVGFAAPTAPSGLACSRAGRSSPALPGAAVFRRRGACATDPRPVGAAFARLDMRRLSALRPTLHLNVVRLCTMYTSCTVPVQPPAGYNSAVPTQLSSTCELSAVRSS